MRNSYFRSLVLALVLLAPLGAAAQSAPADVDPATTRSTSFQSVTGATTEDVPGGPLLIGAYGAIFALVLGYVFYLGRLHVGVRSDLDRLTKLVQAAPEK